jgi:hypothetical protein
MACPSDHTVRRRFLLLLLASRLLRAAVYGTNHRMNHLHITKHRTFEAHVYLFVCLIVEK